MKNSKETENNSRKRHWRFDLVSVLLLVLSLGLLACNKADDKGLKVIKVAVVGEANDMWPAVNENLKSEGLRVELVKFADYNLPNEALNSGEVEMNSFQHRLFLETENKQAGYDLVEIGTTIYAPLTLYSKKHDSLQNVPDGAVIVIPSDPTNSGRSLKLLSQAGLIELTEDAGHLAELKDIKSNPKNLQIKLVEAAQTASFLTEADFAIVNGGHASDNGLSPRKDGLLSEDLRGEADSPFINVLAVRAADKDNADLLKVVEAYHQANVAKAITEAFDGALLPAW